MDGFLCHNTAGFQGGQTARVNIADQRVFVADPLVLAIFNSPFSHLGIVQAIDHIRGHASGSQGVSPGALADEHDDQLAAKGITNTLHQLDPAVMHQDMPAHGIVAATQTVFEYRQYVMDIVVNCLSTEAVCNDNLDILVF